MIFELNGGKDGGIGQNKKSGRRRDDFSICHWSYFDNSRFFHLGSFSVDSWIGWDCMYSYCSNWILTLKRIYAEGLRQRR
jgi:hypothetical protein